MTTRELRFPGESEDYRAARERLLEAEAQLRERTEEVAAERRALPLGGAVPSDYAFEEWDDGAREVHLSDLFAPGKDTLFLYSFMWVPASQGLDFVGPCPSCTSIVDSIDGTVPHLTRQVSFAVAAQAPIDELHAHGERRGWRHTRLLSADPGTYNRDYLAEDDEGNQMPMATVFTRRDGAIHHTWSSEMFQIPREAASQGPRHVDFMWPLWAMLDRTPAGRDPDWEPSLEYRDRE
jgi:predicted dithiol-disulfide oxidoreductase (DUF899 family)